MSRIFDLIAQLETEIDNSPRPKLSNGNKRVVDCDRLLDIIGDIKVTIPEEVRVAQNVFAQRQSIITAAKEETAAMHALARKECEKLISKENVLVQARKRAEGIVERAENNADMLTDGARNYTDEILQDLQRYLREYVGIIEKNRGELKTAYKSEEPIDELATERQPVVRPGMLAKISPESPTRALSAPPSAPPGEKQTEQPRAPHGKAQEEADPNRPEKRRKTWFSKLVEDNDAGADADDLLNF